MHDKNFITARTREKQLHSSHPTLTWSRDRRRPGEGQSRLTPRTATSPQPPRAAPCPRSAPRRALRTRPLRAFSSEGTQPSKRPASAGSPWAASGHLGGSQTPRDRGLEPGPGSPGVRPRARAPRPHAPTPERLSCPAPAARAARAPGTPAARGRPAPPPPRR